MQRKNFLKLIGFSSIGYAMTNLTDLTNVAKSFSNSAKMPVLFVGHGNPMNAIEENIFVDGFRKIASQIDKPNAILCISAHWLTRGTFVTAMDFPKTIHDFGGFPKELSEAVYPALGNPALALETSKLITSTSVALDHDWGLDHGTWSIVKQMYPEADIPVLQLSIDYNKPGNYHYELAKEISALRKKGVLIIGSGNMVHNLGKIAWNQMNTQNYGFDWAIEMNDIFKKKIESNDHQALIQYEKLSSSALLAIPTPDHYYPLLYTLGLQEKEDSIQFFNDKLVAGSLTMTSVKIG
jgi:4,5-DOPA dioxygenase extradiol